jgi:hypothetical protein
MAFKQRKTSDAPAPIPEAHRARGGDDTPDWGLQIGSGACCVGLVEPGLFWAQLRTASAGSSRDRARILPGILAG